MQKEGYVLLVDGDNVPPEILGALLARLEKHGHVAERRIFRNWRSSRNAGAWDDASKAYAFERVDRYRTSAGKNASDIALVVTAMDLLHAGYRSFCIASGDTDFAPLVERLRRAGSHVVLVGHKGEGGILADIADEYLDFRNLHHAAPALRSGTSRRGDVESARTKPLARAVRQDARGQSQTTRTAPRATAAARPARATKAVAARGTRPAQPDRTRQPAKTVGRPSNQRPEVGLDGLRDVLLDSYEVARTDGEVDTDGWVAVDRLGQIARSVVPGFTLAQYGLGSRASLSKAFTKLQDTFQTEAVGRSGNRQYRVRRKG